MAIPKYNEMYQEFLDALKDGKPHKIGAIREILAKDFQVTDEERKELIPSGVPLFNSRVTWTCAYLKQAHLIENTARGIYRITTDGENAVSSADGDKIDNDYLMRFSSFQDFVNTTEPTGKRSKTKSGIEAKDNTEVERVPTMETALSNQSPQDILDDAYNKINDALVDDVLSEVMKQTPAFFEHLVVKLLTAIGYGGSLEGAGIVTQASVDEGIDGIIREDKLGFNKIYIQAKRWDCNNTVSRPEIQKFVGALAGQGATKGLFITTAQFTKGAREYAEQQHTTRIVLVDGKALAKLMIEYIVGVSIEATYYINKIDSDFFDDDLN